MIDLSIIKRFEGCRLNAYKDVIGIPTIGWGSTRYLDGSKVKMGDNITQEQADEMLLEEATRRLSEMALPNEINPNQKAALLSFQYNVGNGNWRNSTLKKKVYANPSDPTIADEFMKWNKAGGQVVRGLTVRRKAEAELYFK